MSEVTDEMLREFINLEIEAGENFLNTMTDPTKWFDLEQARKDEEGRLAAFREIKKRLKLKN